MQRTSAVLVQGTEENAKFMENKLCVLPPQTDMASVLQTIDNGPPIELLKAVNTYTSGMIRCFRVGDAIVAEETDLDTKEILWRPMSDAEEAGAFVTDRMETCEQTH
jgi:hypothetical protein